MILSLLLVATSLLTAVVFSEVLVASTSAALTLSPPTSARLVGIAAHINKYLIFFSIKYFLLIFCSLKNIPIFYQLKIRTFLKLSTINYNT